MLCFPQREEGLDEEETIYEEQIVPILRVAEASMIERATRQYSVSAQSIYLWKRQLGPWK